MIRINLLPKDKDHSKFLALKEIYTLCAILVIFFILGSFFITNYKIKKYKEEVIALKKEETKYNKTIAQIKKIKKKKKEAEQIINLIITLLNQTPTMIKNIDLTIKQIPRKKIYLTKYSYKEPKISIQGMALSLEEVASYINNLEKTRQFKKIILDGINMKKIKNQQLTSFSLSIFLKKINNENKH